MKQPRVVHFDRQQWNRCATWVCSLVGSVTVLQLWCNTNTESATLHMTSRRSRWSHGSLDEKVALYLTASRIIEVSVHNSRNQYRLRAKFLLSKVRKLLFRYMFNQPLKDFSWLFSSIAFFGGDIRICDVWSIRAQLVFGNETRSLYTMRTNATANCLSAFACGKSRELTMWARLHKLPSSVALRRQLRAKIWLTISRKRWRVSRKNPLFSQRNDTGSVAPHKIILWIYYIICIISYYVQLYCIL